MKQNPTVLWAAVAAITVAICFGNSLSNDFVLDDYAIVAVNPAIRTIAPAHVFLTPYWGEKSNSGIYRPITVLSFALEYPLWHRWPGGYRLTNLLLHAVNGLLVFLLARSVLPSITAAYAASLLYLVHPVHTEPVISLVGRSELLAALFFFLAWLLFRQRREGWSAGAFFLSLLSKESAIAFPAIALLDLWVSEGSWKKAISHWRRLAPLVMSGVVYVSLRLSILGGLGVPRLEQYLEGQWTFLQRELTSGRAFLKYLQLLIAPFNIAGDYDFNSIPIASPGDWVAWFGVLLIIVTSIVALSIVKSRPALGFGILFFYVTIVPVSNWIFPTSLIMAERFLYVPSLGLCLIAGWIWSELPAVEIRRAIAVGVCLVAALLCIADTYLWRDNFTFFQNVVRVFPDNLRGRQGYGVALVENGRPDEAREQFEAGLKIKRSAPLLVGLAEAEIQIDHGCVNARQVLDEALRVQPGDMFARWLLASCYEREGSIQQAESTYRQAVNGSQFPDPKLLSAWARLLEKTGHPVEAQEAYRRAALLN